MRPKLDDEMTNSNSLFWTISEALCDRPATSLPGSSHIQSILGESYAP